MKKRYTIVLIMMFLLSGCVTSRSIHENFEDAEFQDYDFSLLEENTLVMDLTETFANSNVLVEANAYIKNDCVAIVYEFNDAGKLQEQLSSNNTLISYYAEIEELTGYGLNDAYRKNYLLLVISFDMDTSQLKDAIETFNH